MVACRVVTDATAFRAVARDAPAGSRVPVEVRVDVDDPWLAYRRARREDDRWGVFLETTGEDAASTAGWNYFAVDPVETLTARRDAVALDAARAATTEPSDGSSPHRNSSTGESAVYGESSDGEPAAYGESSDGEPAAYGESARGDSPSLAALEGLVDGETLVRGDCDVPYPCGAFGWLSYDVARELEALPETTRDDRELPHVEVGVYDRVAAWQTSPVDDRPTTGPDTAGTAQQTPTGHDDAGAGDATRGPASTTLRITVCPRIPADAGSATALDAIHDDAVDRARALAERARTGDPGHGPAPATDVTQATFESDAGRDAYADRVRRVQSAIRDGDTFQANVSHRLRAPAAVHPVAAYDALRRVNPAPYSGLLECPSVDLVSASPELLLECDGRRVRTEPIAGTRPRGDTPAADAALRAELTSDEKERAEHAMLVDLERNDLGKVCTYGSVDVAEYRRVDRYSEVMHLVSDVTGRLRADLGLADAIGAVFPGGTITGAPKPRTMAIIDDVEATRRGPYTGAMAALGFDDRTTLNIVIRTLTRHGEEYHLRVGAGIVHDSDPEREYDETLDKAAALLNAIDDALDADATMHVEVPDP